MISVTRLNHHAILLNSDLIKTVESSPDTVISLVHGEKIIVLEPMEEILDRVIAFRRKVLEGVSWPSIFVPGAGINRKDSDESAPSAQDDGE